MPDRDSRQYHQTQLIAPKIYPQRPAKFMSAIALIIIDLIAQVPSKFAENLLPYRFSQVPPDRGLPILLPSLRVFPPVLRVAPRAEAPGKPTFEILSILDQAPAFIDGLHGIGCICNQSGVHVRASSNPPRFYLSPLRRVRTQHLERT